MVSSCESDYLEPAPTSVISSANYYTTPEQVETAVLNIYDGIQGVFDFGMDENRALQLEFYLTEMRSDNTRTKSSEGEQLSLKAILSKRQMVLLQLLPELLQRDLSGKCSFRKHRCSWKYGW